jgi:hypothetical protein
VSVHLCGRVSSPQELVDHPQLEPEVKRAILASWASDACAVRSMPSLRRPPELSAPIEVDEVLGALRMLDGSAGGARAAA